MLPVFAPKARPPRDRIPPRAQPSAHDWSGDGGPSVDADADDCLAAAAIAGSLARGERLATGRRSATTGASYRRASGRTHGRSASLLVSGWAAAVRSARRRGDPKDEARQPPSRSVTSATTHHQAPRPGSVAVWDCCSGAVSNQSGSRERVAGSATKQERGGVVRVVVGARIHAVASAPPPLCSSSIKASVHTHRGVRGVAFGGAPPPSDARSGGRVRVEAECLRRRKNRSARCAILTDQRFSSACDQERCMNNGCETPGPGSGAITRCRTGLAPEPCFALHVVLVQPRAE
jgi:hypothetical protein